ncbi:hypothetical protein ACFFOM_14215 [Microlunatus capsulatus]|uniref:Uncharacterized protein n=1 Tax=Microlunatus capsulatus TaxID=99117 RepID=A0ABS4Z7S9_9ACTN|nr:hypothetical protein [Microlunatus capsulatus]MBP2417097.1 hypothetical protein [Microlunatus capsulatus]
MWRRLLRLPPREPQLPVLLPEPLAGEVRELLAQDREVEAVRLTRRRTGLDLLLAVRAVQALGPGPSA